MALTEEQRHDLDLGRIEAGLQALIDRPLFEQAIDEQLQRIDQGILRLLEDAGLGSDQVDTLFFTGGSSSVPALRQHVARLLPQARLVEGNRFGSIGTGLAIEAWKRYG